MYMYPFTAMHVHVHVGHADANNKLLSSGILPTLMDTSKYHKDSSCTLELVFKVLLHLVKPSKLINT